MNVFVEDYIVEEENFCTCPKCGAQMGLFSNKEEVGEVCSLYIAHCMTCGTSTEPTNRPFVFQELEVLKAELAEEN